MHHWLIYLLPFTAALIGWLANWVAIKILFHPREPKRFLGITIQGIFPKKQKQFAIKLGSLLAKELFHFDEIARQIKDPQQLENIKPFIADHIDHFLQHKLKEKMPVISMFVGTGTLDKIKEGLLEEIDIMLPELLGKYVENLTANIDIENMLANKLERYSSDKLETILAAVMGNEFRFVGLIGAGLGFLIGLIQLVIALI
jgi:uncharacterized membrane protein YheB (UPF0754 family)